MKWAQDKSGNFWRRGCGRYFVERSRAPDAWVFLAWFKPPQAERVGWRSDEQPVAQCISPKRRHSFREAANDCTAHIQQQQRRKDKAA